VYVRQDGELRMSISSPGSTEVRGLRNPIVSSGDAAADPSDKE
jgi:hypothetical protein